jgi:hypothetical protein
VNSKAAATRKGARKKRQSVQRIRPCTGRTADVSGYNKPADDMMPVIVS